MMRADLVHRTIQDNMGMVKIILKASRNPNLLYKRKDILKTLGYAIETPIKVPPSTVTSPYSTLTSPQTENPHSSSSPSPARSTANQHHRNFSDHC